MINLSTPFTNPSHFNGFSNFLGANNLGVAEIFRSEDGFKGGYSDQIRQLEQWKQDKFDFNHRVIGTPSSFQEQSGRYRLS